MIFQAHKGVCTENPENTMPSFIAAVNQGYKTIELDVSVTSDLKFVLCHDSTINNTARLESGEKIPESIETSSITYEEALQYDFGIGFAKKFKGTKIPLLSDVFELARKYDIKIKIDNKYQRFTDEQKKAFFEFLKPYTDIACLTCFTVKEAQEANTFFPDMHIHYDGEVNEENLEKLSRFLPKDRLTVWLPLECSATWWVKVEYANERLSALVKKYARLGLWILSDKSELEKAELLGAEIVETNGQLKPILQTDAVADMHTHSQGSHDSVCKVEDMCIAQIEKGTKMFAVTDHLDTASFTADDDFSVITDTERTIKELNEKYKGKQDILFGIEIGEGFWVPEVCEKVTYMADYDVIIGSVHLVKYKDLTKAYSGIDFSKLDDETVAEYLDAYFDDMLTMIKSCDFDILAHLTCPLRYIKGKFKKDVDMSRYDEKINKILKLIIKKGIALEVNTSSYGMLGDFMPDIDILKKYRDMRGYLITIGSDAHTANDASKYFDIALQAIKEAGFENIFYYKNRKPYQISI